MTARFNARLVFCARLPVLPSAFISRRVSIRTIRLKNTRFATRSTLCAASIADFVSRRVPVMRLEWIPGRTQAIWALRVKLLSRPKKYWWKDRVNWQEREKKGSTKNTSNLTVMFSGSGSLHPRGMKMSNSDKQNESKPNGITTQPLPASQKAYVHSHDHPDICVPMRTITLSGGHAGDG